MTAYIKLSTGEYPRHPGDIDIDPEKDYAVVEWVDQPSFDPRTQRCEEGSPICIDGTWSMVWSIRDATPEEILEYDEAMSNRPPAANPV
jgi:hypothetical protein